MNQTQDSQTLYQVCAWFPHDPTHPISYKEEVLKLKSAAQLQAYLYTISEGAIATEINEFDGTDYDQVEVNS